MYSGIVNKTRYDDLGKPIKQTSFTVKKPRGKPSQNPSRINIMFLSLKNLLIDGL